MEHKNKFYLERCAAKIAFLEVAGSTGWVFLLTLQIIGFVFMPRILDTQVTGIEISRAQGTLIVNWIAGFYSILLAANAGNELRKRNLNLFFRGGGANDFVRMGLTVMAINFPFVATLVLTTMLCGLNYWLFAGDSLSGLIAGAQFSILFFLPIFAVSFVTMAIGGLVNSGVGAAFGLFVLGVGEFGPGFLVEGAGQGNLLTEIFWVIVPHFNALDWSSNVAYLWKPAASADFLRCGSYGLGVGFISYAVGWALFSKNK